MRMESVFSCVLGITVASGIIAWNTVRLIQTRHCIFRKEPCENKGCKWWDFCDKHGNSLFMDIYMMKKIEKHIKQEENEQNKAEKADKGV